MLASPLIQLPLPRKMTNTSDAAVIASLATSYQQGTTYTPPSHTLGDFDLKRAYELQHAYVANWQTRDTISGFKAAVTAEPMQKAFGLPGPVTSVLFAKGVRESGQTLAATDYRSLLVETELCYRLKEIVTAPINTTGEAKALVARISPAFELADPGFGKARFTGEDLVATNIACGGWIEGPAFDWATHDLDGINAKLTRDDEVLHDAPAGSVMDGQWQALLWLINQTVAKGYTITPDHVLLTGAIGAAHPGQPGHYVAEFGEAGCIEFNLSA